jgi:prolyl-tRNA synthetase
VSGSTGPTEVAPTDDRPWSFAGEPAGPLEKIHTPGLLSIESVCEFLKIAPRQFLKTLVFSATSPIAIRWVVAVVRGDHQIDERKLADAARAMGVTSLAIADPPEMRRTFAVGYVGPDAGTKTPDAVLIVDPDAAQGEIAWAAGANEADHHVRNFNWFREAGDKLADPTKVMVADLIAG